MLRTYVVLQFVAAKEVWFQGTITDGSGRQLPVKVGRDQGAEEVAEEVIEAYFRNNPDFNLPAWRLRTRTEIQNLVQSWIDREKAKETTDLEKVFPERTPIPSGEVKHKVILGGIAHNIAANLKSGHIERVERIGSGFADYRVFIYENDSKDGTPALLRAWAARNPRVVVRTEVLNVGSAASKGGLVRTEMLGKYMNRLLEMINSNSTLTGFEFFMPHATDARIQAPPMDIFSSKLLDSWEVTCASSEMHNTAYGAVQYDAGGLRDSTYPQHHERFKLTPALQPWNPEILAAHVIVLHIRRRFIDLAREEKWNYDQAGSNGSRIFQNARSLMLPVTACAGAMQVYKRKAFEGCIWNGTDDVEHVALQQCILDKGGRLFLNGAWRIPPPTVTLGPTNSWNPQMGSDENLYQLNVPFSLHEGFLWKLVQGSACGVQAPPTEVPINRIDWAANLDVFQVLGLQPSDLERLGFSKTEAEWLAMRISCVRQLVKLAGWNVTEQIQANDEL